MQVRALVSQSVGLSSITMLGITKDFKNSLHCFSVWRSARLKWWAENLARTLVGSLDKLLKGMPSFLCHRQVLVSQLNHSLAKIARVDAHEPRRRRIIYELLSSHSTNSQHMSSHKNFSQLVLYAWFYQFFGIFFTNLARSTL